MQQDPSVSQEIISLRKKLNDLQQQLFLKEVEQKASDKEITLKTHADIEKAKIDRATALDREREITDRELKRTGIEKDAAIQAAHVQAEALANAEIERLKQELNEAKSNKEDSDNDSTQKVKRIANMPPVIARDRHKPQLTASIDPF